jgi:hypothetical protein
MYQISSPGQLTVGSTLSLELGRGLKIVPFKIGMLNVVDALRLAGCCEHVDEPSGSTLGRVERRMR